MEERLNGGHKGFPEYGTLELRHKDELGIATGNWQSVPVAISEKQARRLGFRAHAPSTHLYSLACDHLPQFLHWHSWLL